MKRVNPSPATPTGLLDKQAPIPEKRDGLEVNSWFNCIREGRSPAVDLLDQLKAAGWQHIAIVKIEEVIDERRRMPLGFTAIANCLRKEGCELEVEVTDSHGNSYQVALCDNEHTLLHGHTANRRGPERRVRLKLSTTPEKFGGMLLAKR